MKDDRLLRQAATAALEVPALEAALTRFTLAQRRVVPDSLIEVLRTEARAKCVAEGTRHV